MQGKHMLSRTLDSLRKALSPFMAIPTAFLHQGPALLLTYLQCADTDLPSAHWFRVYMLVHVFNLKTNKKTTKKIQPQFPRWMKQPYTAAPVAILQLQYVINCAGGGAINCRCTGHQHQKPLCESATVGVHAGHFGVPLHSLSSARNTLLKQTWGCLFRMPKSLYEVNET